MRLEIGVSKASHDRGDSSRVEYTPRELLSERDCVNIHRQSLASNKLSNLSQSYKKKRWAIDQRRLTFRRRRKKGTQLESLGSVVVNGCPPLASRICNRVSLKSRPAIEDTAGAAAATADAGAEVVATEVVPPSRRAFSCAAFCARSRLSASICALIAARAFLSFSFSI